MGSPPPVCRYSPPMEISRPSARTFDSSRPAGQACHGTRWPLATKQSPVPTAKHATESITIQPLARSRSSPTLEPADRPGDFPIRCTHAAERSPPERCARSTTLTRPIDCGRHTQVAAAVPHPQDRRDRTASVPPTCPLRSRHRHHRHRKPDRVTRLNCSIMPSDRLSQATSANSAALHSSRRQHRKPSLKLRFSQGTLTPLPLFRFPCLRPERAR